MNTTMDVESGGIVGDNCIAADSLHAPVGYDLSAFFRDVKLIGITVIVTCIAMMAYNYYLYLKVQSKANKKNSKKKSTVSDGDDPFAAEMQGRRASKQLTANSSAVNKSIAASLAQIEGMNASGNFLTAVFSQMWSYMNIAVSNTIKETLEPTLKDMKVPLHFVKLNLGDVPIKMQNMFIHRVDLASGVGTSPTGKKEHQSGIQIDVDVVWDGNCDIMLQATLTKSAKITFGVKHLKLSGRMHILLSPLTNEVPVISAIQYGFTNPPEIQLTFTGAVQSVTSKLGFVQNALISVIQSSLASMLVLPNRMVMPMDLGSYDYLDTYQPPVGMIRLTAVSGRGFTVLKKMLLHDIPDVYCILSLGGSNTFRPPFRTTTKYDNLNPSWEDESCDFILYDMDQKVYVEVFDEDKTPMDPDDPLGKAEVRVRDLFCNDGRCDLELELGGKKTKTYITVSAELFHLSNQLQSLTSVNYQGKNQLCGLATIIVTRAFDIQIPREDAATYIKVVYGEGSKHEKTFYTGCVVDYPGIDALNPMYDCVFHVPITGAMLKKEKSLDELVASAAAAGSSSPTSPVTNGKGGKRNKRMSFVSMAKAPSASPNDITFTLIDSDGANGTTGHGELGKMTVTHDELIRAYNHTITETRRIGDSSAKLEFRISLTGMQSEEEKLSPAPQSSIESIIPNRSLYKSYYSNIDDGVTIRITAVRGRGFDIRKRRFLKKGDVPDVYAVIKLHKANGKVEHKRPTWKTATIKDDTMPTWNESRDYTNVDPVRDVIYVDLYDENKGKGKDEYLGSAKFLVEKLLRKRVLEIELLHGNELTESHVTLRCLHLEHKEEEKVVGDVVVHSHPELGDKGVESTMVNRKKASVYGNTDDDSEDDDDVVMPLVSVSAPPTSRPSRSSYSDDELSLNSASSSSSMSKKIGKMKSWRKRLSISSKKKKEEG